MNNQLSTATNIQAPDLSGARTNSRKYFTNLFAIDFSTSPEINDAVTAFFEELTGNKAAGDALAGTVLYSAIAQGLSPMKVVEDFRNLPQGQINSYLAAFLNINRAPTSALGTKTPVKPNYYANRSVIL